MSDNVDNTLKERGAIYGDYKGGSKFRADVMSLVKQRYFNVNGELLSEQDYIYIFDIVNKLSRLASSPSHIDTWHDIAGYAKLVEEVKMSEQNLYDIKKGKNNG